MSSTAMSAATVESAPTAAVESPAPAVPSSMLSQRHLRHPRNRQHRHNSK